MAVHDIPFASCLKPLFQSEAKCEAIGKKMICILMQITLSLVLNVRISWNSKRAYNFKIAIFKLIFGKEKQKQKKHFRLRKILANR